MTSTDAFIAIREVEKFYGSFQAIANVSMDIRHGEFFSLLGASGCGKTTLLRMLAGFESASSGEICIDGQPMSEVPPYLRPVNMVFQNYAIFPHLNVRDNIAYGLRRLRLPRSKRHEMVEEILDLVKLPGYGDRRANELSGGQRQRVALARALILRPKVLLLDEPLGALDKQLREQMQVELRRLQRSVGITFVFVTHDQEEALTLSDRIAVMAGGRVLQVDTPSRLYEAPRSREVANFIGTMNFLGARVVSRANGHLRLDIEALGQLDLPAGGTPLSEGDRTCVAIRPEKITLHKDRPGGDAPALSGTLEMTTYLGERSHFHVRVPGCDNSFSVSAQNNTIQGGEGQASGRPVWLTWRDDALFVLGKD
ncbi:ABC transporter ATP-binding protein [Pelagibius litoralis]|uniref:Spermidine/putrescine import ATP-binding protein PotA n=1 Tax=Pelagibius litoralis TaxID=374515 RepID=A0A967EXS4_9PROT|nr:ABC transporter ATP-binding protein [Pelagibius litoralis]NIA69355.1 ABC transporter ATP-binding protein [Pelagibius litoralis]